MIETLIPPTLAGRRQAAAAGTLEQHAGESRRQEFATSLRAKSVQIDGKEFVEFEGYATTFAQSYKMWDFYGEYDEQIATTSLDVSLAANPDVSFLLNHTGMTMARTAAGTLILSADSTGLLSVARCNPQRTDVQNLVHAVNDGDVDQMSFAFRILNGRWNEEFTQYTITEVDIDRGDVSAVNFGANPYTSISARARQALDAIDALSGAPLAAATARAQARLTDQTPPPVEHGANLATLRARLELDEEQD